MRASLALLALALSACVTPVEMTEVAELAGEKASSTASSRGSNG